MFRALLQGTMHRKQKFTLCTLSIFQPWPRMSIWKRATVKLDAFLTCRIPVVWRCVCCHRSLAWSREKKQTDSCRFKVDRKWTEICRLKSTDWLKTLQWVSLIFPLGFIPCLDLAVNLNRHDDTVTNFSFLSKTIWPDKSRVISRECHNYIKSTKLEFLLPERKKLIALLASGKHLPQLYCDLNFLFESGKSNFLLGFNKVHSTVKTQVSSKRSD